MSSGPSKPSPYLIPVLILFTLAILVFFGVVINYIAHPAPSVNPTDIPASITPTAIISPTPSTTSTITQTPRPTWTLRPSSTSTLTPSSTSTTTPTLIRTITPAKPANFNDRYELKPWDLAQQDRTIELMKANTILKPSDTAFRALAFAEGEAYIRFPGALEAASWKWDRAYNLLRINDPQGIVLYSELIKTGITSGQVRATDLPAWFALFEIRLDLQISTLPPQPGELGRELIELIDDGSAYLWLVENPAGSTVYPLLNDIDFAQTHENAYLYDDLTGDSTPELVIYRTVDPNSNTLLTPHIFDLSAIPPIELPIQDQVPIDFGVSIQVKAETVAKTQGENKLQVTYTLFPACPAYASQGYGWNGSEFISTPLSYDFAPAPENLAYCQQVLDQASSNWGPEAAIKIANALLDVWPPKTDLQGHPYPADAYDQLRYRLGVLYALAYRDLDAIKIMSEIVDTPIVPDSTWVAPAEQFLRVYFSSTDLYPACQQAQFCNMRDAFRTIVHVSTSYDPPIEVMDFVQGYGRVTIRSSGLLDFDGDGQAERWLIIQPKPETKLEFWIINPLPHEEVQAVFVQVLEAGTFLPYIHEPAGTIPVIEFELHKGFIFKRIPGSGEAYIQWVDVEYARPTVILDGYTAAVNSLFDGAPPMTVRGKLLELFNSPRFKGDCIAFNICDQFHYALALANDLVGEGGSAIDEYLWVWRNYGSSPFTTMARLKLDYFPLPTYTRTPVPTNTPAPTRTPTLSPTQTLTRTPTSSPTPTNTSTSTVTPTSTIKPTQTSTNTPLGNP